jgi:hypothetical protein
MRAPALNKPALFYIEGAWAESGAVMNTRARDKGHVEFVQRVAPVLAELRAAGVFKPDEIASVLNVRGVPAPNGKKWSALQVLRIDALSLGDSKARFSPNLNYVDRNDKVGCS